MLSWLISTVCHLLVNFQNLSLRTCWKDRISREGGWVVEDILFYLYFFFWYIWYGWWKNPAPLRGHVYKYLLKQNVHPEWCSFFSINSIKVTPDSFCILLWWYNLMTINISMIIKSCVEMSGNLNFKDQHSRIRILSQNFPNMVPQLSSMQQG